MDKEQAEKSPIQIEKNSKLPEVLMSVAQKLREESNDVTSHLCNKNPVVVTS